MRYTLRQLMVFEAVARHKSFTQAAREMFLTQPAVSIQVKLLEESLGLPLFEQIGKKLFLTQAGEETYQTTLDILSRLKTLEANMADLQGGVRGQLNLSVVTAANYFAPLLLGAFLRLHPGVNVKLQVTNREHVLERLTHNQDDLVIMGQVPEHLPVEAAPFLDNLLVMVAPPAHPLVGQTSISLQRLAQEKFLVREPGSGTRIAMEDLFAQQGLAIPVAMELGSAEAIKYGVMAGLGLTLMSTHNLMLELAGEHLVALDVEGLPLRRHWYAVLMRGKRRTRITQTFLDFIQAHSAQVLEEALQE